MLTIYKMPFTVFDQPTHWCKQYDKNIKDSKEKQHIYNNFDKYVAEFVTTLKEQVTKGENVTYVHFGDGDYFFLTKQAVGSATPGKRALSIGYDKIDAKLFRKNMMLNDYICVEFLENVDIHYNKLFPERQIDIYTDIIYAGVSSRWFTKTFSERIGLIGADAKLDLIKELMKHKRYQEYLGLNDFTDYIKLPQKFACDDLRGLEKSLKNQLEESDSKTRIYLCGMGHVKSYIFSKLKTYKNAVYIDVGSGIDAIAGIIDHQRPYMLNWINHQLSSPDAFDYSKIDYLQYDMKKDITRVLL